MFARIFLNGFIADFNGILYTITETEMTCDVKNDRTEIEG